MEEGAREKVLHGDGLGDTWYDGWHQDTVTLARPFLDRGVPPHFRLYDLRFLHWLAWNHQEVDVLSDADLERDAEVAERTRIERSAVTLEDRLRGAAGRVDLVVLGGGRGRGAVVEVGEGWVLLADHAASGSDRASAVTMPSADLSRSKPSGSASTHIAASRGSCFAHEKAAELRAETKKFAERLARNPPAAIGATKALVYQAATASTKAQLDAEEKNIIGCMQSEDFRVAVKKFTSKSK